MRQCDNNIDMDDRNMSAVLYCDRVGGGMCLLPICRGIQPVVCRIVGIRQGVKTGV